MWSVGMLVPVVNWSDCQSCVSCQAVTACKTRAILQIDSGEPPFVELSRCSGCGACIQACCCQAIVMKNPVGI